MNKTEKIKFHCELDDRALLRGVLNQIVKETQAEVIHKVCDGDLSGDEALAEIDKLEMLFEKINDRFRSEQYGFNSGEVPYIVKNN